LYYYKHSGMAPIRIIRMPNIHFTRTVIFMLFIGYSEKWQICISLKLSWDIKMGSEIRCSSVYVGCLINCMLGRIMVIHV